MTPEEQKEYDDYCNLFATDGWKKFINGMEDIEDSVVRAAVDNAPLNDQWQFLRGQINQIRTIVGFEAYVQAVHDQLKEEEEEDESDSSGL